MINHRRRGLLQAAASSLALGVLPARAALAPTPRQTVGPFYPQQLPLDHDNDLVRIRGRANAALGEVSHLSGRVLDMQGQPLAHTRVEIWQCDAQGFYHHADDRGRAARDGGFQGFGQTLTDVQGRYRFRTIKPVPYPGRTPHIHAQVVPASGRPFATQIYIRGHAANEKDFLFSRLDVAERQRVEAAFERWDGDDAMWTARFDLVVPGT